MHEQPLKELFYRWSGSRSEQIVPLPVSGSSRQYLRLSDNNYSAIGVYHTDDLENRAFIYFAEHFKAKGIRVPEIYLHDLKHQVYLQQDLGDLTLFGLLQENEGQTSAEAERYLKMALEDLPVIQVIGNQGVDYSKAYPREAFDRQSMRWDLNYFKYHFLKFTGLNFNEQKLENDFDTIISTLNEASRDYFLFRDFQSRNVMVDQGQVWFIDFQGGRKGFPAYDLASMLFDAKADLNPDIRQRMLTAYLEKLKEVTDLPVDTFLFYYPGFILIRKLQAMGAFGFRGIFEGKTHFLQSIPYALANIEKLFANYTLPFDIPELRRVLTELPGSAFHKTVLEKLKSLPQ